MRVRRKKRTKRLIVLLSLLLLGIVGFRNILPNLGDVFQYHHVASGEYGWNLILVNRDNYIPDDYTVEIFYDLFVITYYPLFRLATE